MPFVVKATGAGLSVKRLAPRSDISSHTLGPRTSAVVFPTDTEAQAAAVEATESLGRLGMIFSVEAED
jgi:hypothetical protein